MLRNLELNMKRSEIKERGRERKGEGETSTEKLESRGEKEKIIDVAR